MHAGDVFVIAQTVTKDCVMSDYFAPGNSVVFRAYAVDGKTRKVLVGKDVTYFYVKIPNSQPNVKLTYTPTASVRQRPVHLDGHVERAGELPDPASSRSRCWSSRRRSALGSFVQMPVVTSQLTISTTPNIPAGPGPAERRGAVRQGRHGHLRRQRQRDAPRGRGAAADRLHADQRVQAR